MVNLKIDPELLIHRIGKAGDSAQDLVRRVMEDAKKEVEELSEILPELERLAHPIVRDAAIAVAKTVEIGAQGADARPSIEIRINHGGCGIQEYARGDSPLPAGKYRALFFLIPVGP